MMNKIIWTEETKKPIFSTLEKDTQTDVVVVGGGIAGITTAYLLKNSGFKVVVLEKNQIASGTTGGTTGKVTVQHGIFYDELIRRQGYKRAKIYADSFSQALIDMAKIIKEDKINCDWQECNNFVFTSKSKNINLLKKEVQSASKLSLPASFVTKTELPFEIAGAVKFSGQAKFNAAKYTYELAKKINRQGSYVFENAQAKHFQEGEICKVKTKNHTIYAKHVVIATKIPPSPLIARLMYGLIEYPQTSYIIAGRSPVNIKDTYISPDKQHYSIFGIDSNILIGGEKHIPGLGLPNRHYKNLTKYGQNYFKIEKPTYHWKEIDYIAYDKLPAIGKLYPWSKNYYVITGFKK